MVGLREYKLLELTRTMNTRNEDWLEKTYEYFDRALSKGDVAVAKTIICDMNDAGFRRQARDLTRQLHTEQITSLYQTV